MQRQPRKLDKKHLAFVAERPCLICGTNVNVDAHHIKMADARVCKPQSSNIGMKADDRYTLPLCRTHHEQLHCEGERKFFSGYHVDACLLALCLYTISGNAEEGDRLISLAGYALQELRDERCR